MLKLQLSLRASSVAWTFLAVFAVLNTQTSFGRPIVPAYQRHADAIDIHQRGQLLFEELNCRMCHGENQDKRPTSNAPTLTEVTNRARIEYLRRYIAEPHQVKPGTRMPDVYKHVDQPVRDQEVEAILHYLASLASEPSGASTAAAALGGKQRGAGLYHRVGCVACHNAYDEATGKPKSNWPDAVPHGDLDAKYALPGLRDLLLDPLASHPAARMPSLNLSRAEAADIAAFLLPSVPERGGISFARYRGDWQQLPDFDKLQPITTGLADEFGPRAGGGGGDHYGLRFDAKIAIPEDGEYEFSLASDDGSRLLIDQKRVVENDGVHGTTRKSGRIQLKAGSHFVRVEFFEQAGGEELHVRIKGPGVEEQRLRHLVDRSTDRPLRPFELLKPQPNLVEQGRQYFSNRGCIACHDVSDAKASPFASKSIVKTDQGCLAASPQVTSPRYGLSKQQRSELQLYVESDSSGSHGPQSDDHEAQVRHQMLAFNCYACHARNELGGVTEERNVYFVTEQTEMGDEGRLPPALDGVGAKLKRDWLEATLAQGLKVRPYVQARMPKFGAEHAKAIAINLEHDASQIDQLDPIELNRKEARLAGWKMVGDKGGFGCIKCHTFGSYRATGVQSVNMTIMTERLRENWFRQYLRNPQRFRRGTRMPSAWPEQGKSYLKDLFEGDSEKQIVAVWNYLEAGSRARLPAGLVTNSMLLLPIDEALIYRNFIEGAGPRAIGVGYPEGIHLAFDANDLRLALIWQGTFMDAKRHWTGRGQGFQAPAGEKVIRLPNGPAFAYLEDGEEWPIATERPSVMQFRGYRLSSDQRPTFHYRSDSVDIHDQPNAVEYDSHSELVRNVQIKLRPNASHPEQSLNLRLAVDANIEARPDGRFLIGDALEIKCKLPANVTATVHQGSDMHELRVIIPPDAPTVEFTVNYRW